MVQHNTMNISRGWGLITLTHVTHYFKVYSNGVKHFKDQLFLVTSLNEEPHAKICVIKTKPECRCTNLFRKL